MKKIQIVSYVLISAHVAVPVMNAIHISEAVEHHHLPLHTPEQHYFKNSELQVLVNTGSPSVMSAKMIIDNDKVVVI